MAPSSRDPLPERPWRRRDRLAYGAFVATYPFAIGTLIVAIETGQRPLALGILLVGVAVVVALIGYAVWHVRHER
jgi:hypothetical protein